MSISRPLCQGVGLASSSRTGCSSTNSQPSEVFRFQRPGAARQHPGDPTYAAHNHAGQVRLIDRIGVVRCVVLAVAPARYVSDRRPDAALPAPAPVPVPCWQEALSAGFW